MLSRRETLIKMIAGLASQPAIMANRTIRPATGQALRIIVVYSGTPVSPMAAKITEQSMENTKFLTSIPPHSAFGSFISESFIAARPPPIIIIDIGVKADAV